MTLVKTARLTKGQKKQAENRHGVVQWEIERKKQKKKTVPSSHRKRSIIKKEEKKERTKRRKNI